MSFCHDGKIVAHSVGENRIVVKDTHEGFSDRAASEFRLID